MVNNRVSHYKILDKLGAGGMGEGSRSGTEASRTCRSSIPIVTSPSRNLSSLSSWIKSCTCFGLTAELPPWFEHDSSSAGELAIARRLAGS